jgi:DNA-binding CsgD family transcriptional regulator
VWREHLQLAAELGRSRGVSVKTAEAHRANLMHKLNLHAVSGLIRYAIRHKIAEA